MAKTLSITSTPSRSQIGEEGGGDGWGEGGGEGGEGLGGQGGGRGRGRGPGPASKLTETSHPAPCNRRSCMCPQALLRWGNAFFVIGALGMAFAPPVPNLAFWTVAAARFVSGIGGGFAQTVASLYISELAPAKKRGACRLGSAVLSFFLPFFALFSL